MVCCDTRANSSTRWFAPMTMKRSFGRHIGAPPAALTNANGLFSAKVVQQLSGRRWTTLAKQRGACSNLNFRDGVGPHLRLLLGSTFAHVTTVEPIFISNKI